MKYTFILTSCNAATMVTNKSKIYFFVDSYTFCLCWMHWFVSHLIYLSLSKLTMPQYFHPGAKYLLYRYITPSFVRHSFRVEGETFLPIHRCAFWFKSQKYFVCRCASRTLRMKLLKWCRVISLAGLFGTDSGLKFVLIFQACIQNFIITSRVTTFFIRGVELLCSAR